MARKLSWPGWIAAPVGVRIAITVALAVIALNFDLRYQYLTMTVLTGALAALGLTVLIGWVGQPSVMTGGLMILGGYTSALLIDLPFLLVCAASAAAGLVFGVLVGSVHRRLAGLYPVLASLAIFEIIVLLGKQLQISDQRVAGYEVDRPDILGFSIEEPAAWIAVLVITLFLVSEYLVALRKSRLGRAWLLTLERRDAAVVAGIDVPSSVTTAHAIAAGVQFLAGSMAAAQIGFASYDSTTLLHSVGFIIMVVLGGLGSLPGAVVGAAIVTALPQVIQWYGAEANLNAQWASRIVPLQGILVAVIGIFVVLRVDRRFARILRDARKFAPRSWRTSKVERSTDSGPALSLDGVSVTYDDIEAVSDVSLTVTTGSCLALVGPNGAGKTSILRAIAGFSPHSGGQVSVGNVLFARDGRTDNLVVRHWTPATRARAGIAYIPADDKVFATLSVRDNLVETISRTRSHQTQNEQLESVLGIFPGLKPLLDAQAGLLSGGERQQLALAVGVASRPRILLVDEASLGLAPATIRMVTACLRRLLQERPELTLVIAEPNLDVVFGLANTVAVVDQGQIVRIGNAVPELRAFVEKVLMGEALPASGEVTWTP